MPKKYLKNECTIEQWEQHLSRKRAVYKKMMLDVVKKSRKTATRRRNYNLSKNRSADHPVRYHSPKANSKEESLAKAKRYRSTPENLAKKRAYGRRPEVRARARQRYAEDHNYRLRSILTTALKYHINKQGAARKTSVLTLLGIGISDFRRYLESLFEPGMAWENYGRFRDGRKSWEIDHIIPCSAFDFNDSTQLEQCWHYRNMQPMWASANRSKGGYVRMSRKD